MNKKTMQDLINKIANAGLFVGTGSPMIEGLQEGLKEFIKGVKEPIAGGITGIAESHVEFKENGDYMIISTYKPLVSGLITSAPLLAFARLEILKAEKRGK